MTTITGALTNLSTLANVTSNLPSTQKWPVLFVGHGSPMNALMDNPFTQSLLALGKRLGKPNAILVVSAHWETAGTFVATTDKPPVIYDFGGFPEALYQVKYPAPGAPEMARTSAKEIHATQVLEDAKMGLDHGAWTILKFLYPEADVPVFEMSLDYRKDPSYHFAIGQELKALRKKGVLIIGSGNVVHNLGMADFRHKERDGYDWAIEFDENLKRLIDKREFSSVVNYQKLGVAAQKSIPTNEHFLPLLYILGLVEKSDSIEYVYEGMEHGSISMRSILFGSINN